MGVGAFASTPFEHGAISVEGGMVAPLFELSEVFDRVPMAQGEMSFSYANGMRSQISLAYAKLTGWKKSQVEHLVGSMGLDYAVPYLHGFEIGAGIGLFFERATSPLVQSSSAVYYQLSSNESDFGWICRGRMPLFHFGEKTQLHLGVNYQQIWTSPIPSRFFWIGIGVGVALW
jgi:hypothetical protein